MAELADAETMRLAHESPGDAGLLARFELAPKKNEAKSLEEGRPVFDSVEYVTIAVPGDKNSIIRRPARPEDKHRFSKQYEAYKRGETEATTGTPLSAWPLLERAQVEELAHFHVRTVEQLANLQDAHAQRFPGIQKLKQQAKDWLAAAKDAAYVQQMRAELQTRDNELETLRRALKEQGERIDQLTKQKGKA